MCSCGVPTQKQIQAMVDQQDRDRLENEDMPDKVCPRCGVVTADYDGFGVTYCDSCGFCSHSSVTGGYCNMCYEKI